MSTFNHHNVLTLRGVCLDGGPAPYIIMPFMANGSLLSYLKKNRNTLIVSSENDDDDDKVSYPVICSSTLVISIAIVAYGAISHVMCNFASRWRLSASD